VPIPFNGLRSHTSSAKCPAVVGFQVLLFADVIYRGWNSYGPMLIGVFFNMILYGVRGYSVFNIRI
jgi:hypothetical protein